jgi:hypothetical protein
MPQTFMAYLVPYLRTLSYQALFSQKYLVLYNYLFMFFLSQSFIVPSPYYDIFI